VIRLLALLGWIVAGAVWIAGSAAGPTWAGDGVPARGILSDKDFFRLATCGARVGGPCQGPSVRWRNPNISVALTSDPGGMPPKKAKAVSDALDAAIAEINAAGSAVRLTRNDALRRANIIVRRVPIREGGRTKGIPDVNDGERIGVGYNFVWWVGNRDLTQATVLISYQISYADLKSVMLEEVFQSLGFRFDIENRRYEGRSILSQDSNATTKIRGQDAAILRMLYPK
jgi:hypothetical protein